jgi:SpoIID/LytB domain protein
MRSWSLLARACTATALVGVTPVAAHAQAATALIPALQVDGRGHGHGVGMAQDGALAMGKAGANVKQILAQFYPDTAIGKASGNVRVPIVTGNGVELGFPEGGDIRSTNASLHIPPGGNALFTREGDGTRVKTANAPAATTTTTTTVATTTTSTAVPAATTTTLLSVPGGKFGARSPNPTIALQQPAPTTSTTAPPTSTPTFAGPITVTPTGDGRIAVTARNRRYRGAMEATPVQGGVRFVNQVGVETYLRGMGEVRNPSWPAAGLQAQAIAARTYALRAMAFGGELCDSQRCQVYIGADAEYAAMDKAVAATSGQVLTYGKSLASAVYSANAGGFSANREEGFGLAGDTYPYLRAAPYLTDNRDEWSVTIALTDVARRLSYAGELTAVTVVTRGPSGRATSLNLIGTKGEKTVSGIDFDAALGLRSTLFTVKGVMASKVATLTGGSVLQAPPEDASALASAAVASPAAPRTAAIPVRLQQPVDAKSSIGLASLLAAALWGAVVVSAFRWRRRARTAITKLLS